MSTNSQQNDENSYFWSTPDPAKTAQRLNLKQKTSGSGPKSVKNLEKKPEDPSTSTTTQTESSSKQGINFIETQIHPTTFFESPIEHPAANHQYPLKSVAHEKKTESVKSRMGELLSSIRISPIPLNKGPKWKDQPPSETSCSAHTQGEKSQKDSQDLNKKLFAAQAAYKQTLKQLKAQKIDELTMAKQDAQKALQEVEETNQRAEIALRAVADIEKELSNLSQQLELFERCIKQNL